MRLLQFDFGVDQDQDFAESLGDAGGLENRLFVLEFEVEVIRNIVGKLPCILEVHDKLGHFGLDIPAACIDQVGKLLFELTEGRFGLDRIAIRDFDGADLGFEQAT